MRHHRTPAGSDELPRVQRALVNVLLGEDHDGPWTRDELAASARVNRSVLDRVLEHLQADQVVVLDGDHIEPSRCAKRLDELKVIGV